MLSTSIDTLTPEGDHLITEPKDSKDGNYTVTYTPQFVGEHSVIIQVNGLVVPVLCRFVTILQLCA